MKELSLNILDLVQNSITAGAGRVTVTVTESEADDRLSVGIENDGCGMEEDFLRRVTDPFTTTRTTRRVGMGIPLFKMEAEMAGGSFEITSRPGEGTRLSASFQLSHLDTPPLGDMAGTVAAIVQSTPDMELYYEHRTDTGEFLFSTAEIREALGGVSLSEPAVVEWIGEYVRENEQALRQQPSRLEGQEEEA